MEHPKSLLMSCNMCVLLLNGLLEWLQKEFMTNLWECF